MAISYNLAQPKPSFPFPKPLKPTVLTAALQFASVHTFHIPSVLYFLHFVTTPSNAEFEASFQVIPTFGSTHSKAVEFAAPRLLWEKGRHGNCWKLGFDLGWRSDCSLTSCYQHEMPSEWIDADLLHLNASLANAFSPFLSTTLLSVPS